MSTCVMDEPFDVDGEMITCRESQSLAVSYVATSLPTLVMGDGYLGGLGIAEWCQRS